MASNIIKNDNMIQVGDKVTIKLDNEIVSYTIVPTKETYTPTWSGYHGSRRSKREYSVTTVSDADPKKGTIADNSPLAKNLIGKNVGATFLIDFGFEKMKCSVISTMRNGKVYTKKTDPIKEKYDGIPMLTGCIKELTDSYYKQSYKNTKNNIDNGNKPVQEIKDNIKYKEKSNLRLSDCLDTKCVLKDGEVIKFNLYDELKTKIKEWRRNKAYILGIPAYIIFPDTTLNSLTSFVPTSVQQLWLVSGFDIYSIEEYGEEIVKTINYFLSQKNIVEILHGKKSFNVKQPRIRGILGYIGILNEIETREERLKEAAEKKMKKNKNSN